MRDTFITPLNYVFCYLLSYRYFLKIRLLYQKLLKFIIVSLCFFSCITPPIIEKATVLPQEELKIISLVKKGKDYSLGGRNDLAEEQFRKVLKLKPDYYALYNDLGYVIYAQDRLLEAKKFFEKAVQLAPDNFTARENYARVLYKLNEYAAALEQYDAMLDIIGRLSESDFARYSGRDLTNGDFVHIYQNMAEAYFALGQIDEAACYMWAAHVRAATLSQAQKYLRFLMYLERLPQAKEVVQNVLLARNGNISTSMYLDYSIVLFSLGNKELARAALTRVLSDNKAEKIEARLARFLLLSIDLTLENYSEARNLHDSIFEAEPDLCSNKNIEHSEYWTKMFADEIENIFTKLCNNEIKFILEN